MQVIRGDEMFRMMGGLARSMDSLERAVADMEYSQSGRLKTAIERAVGAMRAVPRAPRKTFLHRQLEAAVKVLAEDRMAFDSERVPAALSGTLSPKDEK